MNIKSKLLAGIFGNLVGWFKSPKPTEVLELVVPDDFLVVGLPDNQAGNKIRRVVEDLKPLRPGIDYIIAGGCVRLAYLGLDITTNDIDIFFKGEPQFLQAHEKLSKYRVEFRTKRANTYSSDYGTIQIIRNRFHPKVTNCTDDFDFTVCKLMSNGDKILVHRDAEVDLKRRRLRKNSGRDIIISRVLKYMNHGYMPSSDDLKFWLSSSIMVPLKANSSFGFVAFQSSDFYEAPEVNNETEISNYANNTLGNFFDTDENRSEIKKNCVLSKLSNSLVFAKIGGEPVVFFDGVFMNMGTFYTIVAKAINVINIPYQVHTNISYSVEKVSGKKHFAAKTVADGLRKHCIEDFIENESPDVEGGRKAIKAFIDFCESEINHLDQQIQQ